MTTISIISMSFVMFLSGTASASAETSAASKGSASSTAGEKTYQGTYSASTKSVSVEIDGLTYKGSYASVAEDSAGPASGAVAGKWGRAFLFASSGKTLRCQLDEAFPKVSGKCQDAGGRQFHLTSGAAQRAAAIP